MNHFYYYQQGCISAQQAAQAELVGNFNAAAAYYDGAIAQLSAAINGAIQLGIFIPDNTYCPLGFCYFKGAIAKNCIGDKNAAYYYLGYAINTLNQAIAMNPTYFYYHSLMGEILAFQGNLVEAQRAFHTALQLNPMDARAYWMLGFLYSAMQQPAQATQCYQHAQQIQPNVPQIPATSANPASPNWIDVVVKVSGAISALSPAIKFIFQKWK
jgi:tetratricopeptide (TPR) repeat protein